MILVPHIGKTGGSDIHDLLQAHAARFRLSADCLQDCATAPTNSAPYSPCPNEADVQTGLNPPPPAQIEDKVKVIAQSEGLDQTTVALYKQGVYMWG